MSKSAPSVILPSENFSPLWLLLRLLGPLVPLASRALADPVPQDRVGL